jgi:hypothetical protein
VSGLRVAPIVEGHGEVSAIRILISRVWTELLGGGYADVIQPIRRPKSKLVKEAELERAVELAALKLRADRDVGIPWLVLILLDANGDCPAELGPALLARARQVAGHADIACVIAKVEYETWFVAAAESLSEYLDLAAQHEPPVAPEHARCGKRWVEQRFRTVKYSETVDQPRMTAAMDLLIARARAPSFDKLCRELERRFRLTGQTA